jgi:hypothetical protein
VIGVINPSGRFERRENFDLPFRHTSTPFTLGEQGVQDCHVLGGVNLGSDNSGEARTENSFEVVTGKPCIQSVEAYREQWSVVLQALEGSTNIGTCGALVRAWNRILEIQNQGICPIV